MFGAAAAWSTTGLWIRWAAASADFSALSLAFWRDLATALVLIAGLAVARPRLLRVARRDMTWLALLGALGVGTFHVLWNLALLHIDIAVATVLLYSSPIYVTLGAWVIWREPLTRFKVLAVVLALAGCVLAAGLEQVEAVQITAGGLILGLGAALAYSSFSLVGRHLTGRYSPWTILTYGFAFAALVLLPLQFGAPQPWPVPAQTWLWLAGLVLVATVVPFGLYLTGLLWLPVSVASILSASEVVCVALIGYVAFGEQLGGRQLVGAGLVVVGVLLLTLKGTASAPRGDGGTTTRDG